MYLRGCHSVFYVKACELIMPAGPCIRSHYSGYKPHGHEISQGNRLHARLHKDRQKLIVRRQTGKHPSPEGPPVFSLRIIMLHPAFLAAELLVRPAITDLVTAMQAMRYLPRFPYILHTVTIFMSGPTQLIFHQISAFIHKQCNRPESGFYLF